MGCVDSDPVELSADDAFEALGVVREPLTCKGPFEPVLIDIDGVTVTRGHALLVRLKKTGFAIHEWLLNEIRSR